MSDLTPDVIALLAAVVEALDIPMPDIDDTDERAHRWLLERRTTDLHIILASILDYPDLGIDDDADTIRARTAKSPVTYTVFVPEQAEGGEPQ